MPNRSNSLHRRLLLAALSLSLFALPLARAQAARAGGSITGSVTDQRGAVVVGATVTIYSQAGGQVVANVRTDAQGRTVAAVDRKSVV